MMERRPNSPHRLRIPAGHVTQIRFEIRRAWMVFPDTSEEPISLDVPSGTLRTDKQIDWTLTDGGAMSLTVHFDLSQSIVRSGPAEQSRNTTSNRSFIFSTMIRLRQRQYAEPSVQIALLMVILPKVDVFVDLEWVAVTSGVTESQPYTHVTVLRESNTDPTDFCIYWLVPLDAGESYDITIDNGGGEPYYVVVPELESGVTPFELNGGVTITIPSTHVRGIKR